MLRLPSASLACGLFLAPALALAGAPPPPVPDVPDVPAATLAQRPGKPDKPPKRKGAKGGRFSPEEREALQAEVERKIDTFLTVELSTRLGLTDEKALKLSRLLKARREQRQQDRKTTRQEYKKLQELVDAGASDAQLKAQTATVVAAHRKSRDNEDLLGETAKFLTPREQALLVLAFPHLQQETQRMLKQARRDGRARGRARGSFDGPPDVPPGPGGFDGLDGDF